MRHRIALHALLATALGLAGGTAHSVNAAPAASAQVKVLVLTGLTDSPYHDWRESTPFLRQVLASTGRFEIKVIEDCRGLTAAALAGYDVLLLHYNGPRWDAGTEKAIEEFVRRGGGLVSIHGVTYGEFYGMKFSGKWTAGEGKGWAAYADLIGATWKPENIGHSVRHVFPVEWVLRDHPIAKGMDPSFVANDELYHKLDLRPGVEVIASAFSDPAKGGTGKKEPMLWTGRFGQGRILHCPLGHDLSAMWQPGFLSTLARSLEWAATGAVTLPASITAMPPRGPSAARVLVVTGGHGYPPDFYTLFEGNPGIAWSHAASQSEAFGRPLAGRYDAIVLHDMGETIGEKEKKNLQAFVEAGGGVVSTHHAIVDYTSWPWWYEEVIGGKYFVQPVQGHAKSEYKEGVDFVVTIAKGMGRHPVLAGVPPLVVHDEVYKNMWHSPRIQVLMETDHPLNDKPVVYVGPHAKARVVFIQLGHGASTMRYPGYKKLVENSILWVSRKTGS